MGSRCRVQMAKAERPCTQAAATYGSERSRSAALRSTRATYGVYATVRPRTTGIRPGPITATVIRAKTMPGTANSTSRAREISASTFPPYHAAVMASAVPRTAETQMTRTGPRRVVRAPHIRRDRTSRPSASPPSQWSGVA